MPTTPVSEHGYPEKESDGSGNWVHRELYKQRTANVADNLPEYESTTNQNGVTVTDPDGLQLYCKRRYIRVGPAPGISIVELEYSLMEVEPLDFSDNPKTVRLERQEIPIDDERLLSSNDGPFTSAQIADAKEAGYKSLPLYTIRYTYTEVDASFTWSEANIIDSLQTTGVPDGISAGTAANWQLTGKEIDENRRETVIRTHYEYAGPGFVPLTS